MGLSENLNQLRRLAVSLRAAAAATREVTTVEGFTLLLAAESRNPFMSLAVPDDEPPVDWERALAALPAAFSVTGHRARIETFAELQPALLRAADEAGWLRAMTSPVLTLVPEALTPAPTPAGRFVWLALGEPTRTEAALRGSHLAFGGAEGAPTALDWRQQLERGLRLGSLLAGVVEVAGVPRAGALLQHGGDASELAGVWTHPDFRRRGLARQACYKLLATAFGQGLSLAWLSAADGAQELYERLGFVRVGTQVNLEPPD